jgi:hypothetical protein
MLKRIRSFFGNTGAQTSTKPNSRLQGLVGRFLSGSTQSNPLYLTNRTTAQKIKLWLAVTIPAALVVGALAAVWLGIVDTAPPQPPGELSPSQIAEKLLPDLSKPLDVPTDHTLEVVDVHIDHAGPAKVMGVVKNTTSTAVAAADLTFELTNRDGSRMGAVGTRVATVPANGSVKFELPIVQEKAAFAFVREIHRL